MSLERNAERYERILDTVWYFQASRLAKAYSEAMHKKEEEYIRTAPKFSQQASSVYGIPLLVERRLPFEQATSLLGIQVSDKIFKRLSNYSNRELTRSIWINDDFRGLHGAGPCSPNNARSLLKENERTLDPYEMISYFLFYPERLGLASAYSLLPEGDFQLKVINKKPRFFKSHAKAHYLNSSLIVTTNY